MANILFIVSVSWSVETPINYRLPSNRASHWFGMTKLWLCVSTGQLGVLFDWGKTLIVRISAKGVKTFASWRPNLGPDTQRLPDLELVNTTYHRFSGRTRLWGVVLKKGEIERGGREGKPPDKRGFARIPLCRLTAFYSIWVDKIWGAMLNRKRRKIGEIPW